MAKSKVIGIAKLDKELSNIINDYTKTLAGNVDKSARKITKELVEDIQNNARSQGLRRRPRYIEGWTYKKVGDIFIVHNKTDYQLTHLLEKGHVKRGGGRVIAYTHIRPAELAAIKKFELAIRKAAERS
mgnify:CR=1 FL=1